MFDGWIMIDRESDVALSQQIYRQLRDAVRTKRVAPGSSLPSSRALATMLGVSRNTASAAYDLLRAEAVITVGRGAAPVFTNRSDGPVAVRMPSVTPRLSTRGLQISADRHRLASHGTGGMLRAGTPDPALFPRDLWARSLRRATRSMGGRTLLYDHAEGLPELRATLAIYLAGARGISVTPDNLLILPTIQSALAMLAHCLIDSGDQVWIEDPGYVSARVALAEARLDPMPVDDDGADPRAMTGMPRLIYVTPSHQYPTGARMSMARRLSLLAAARAHGAIVIEDDYDSEFLWHGRPVPALHALSEAGEVIYVGTVAKSLLPGLRLAYLAVPPGLAAALARVQRNLGLLANVHAQAAFADLIDSGQYRAHLGRISAIYQRRAAVMADAIRAHCGDRVRIAPPAGGLQLLARLAPDIDDAAIAARLADKGYGIGFLSGMCLGPPRRGLVIGFGDADADMADRFARALSDVLDRRVP